MMELAKTPINVLKTLCIKKNWTVDYKMMAEEGRVHEPTFTFRVFIEENGLDAIAAGYSKKKAKQAAALKLLQTLAETDEEAATELATLEEVAPNELEATTSTDKSNPVGKLQEICMRKKWKPPEYFTDEEDGPPHAKTFTITCILEDLDLESKGQDKSKKGGKKIAAQEMLTLLEEKGLYDAQVDSIKSTKRGAIEFKPDDSEADKIVTFFRNITDNDLHRRIDDEVSISDDENHSNDYVNALIRVSNSIGLMNTFIDIKSEQNHLLHHVIVTLKPPADSPKDVPMVTGWGIDNELDKAKQKAAHTALILLDKVRYL